VTRSFLILAIVLAGAFAVPFAVLPHAFDAFRLPKELALRGEAILLIAVFAGALISGYRPHLRVDHWLILPLVAIAWMLIVTAGSTNVVVSATRLAAGVATLIVFLATMQAAELGSAFLPLVALPLLAAAGNAVIDILQETNIWMPFGTLPDVRHHYQCTAFIGNPNEVGSYLAVASLGCIAAAIADRARRPWFAGAAVLLVAGVVASQTLTALASLIAGVFVLFALVSWKHALRVAVIAAITATIVVASIAPLRQRASNMAQWLRHGDYNSLLTDRLTPFAAASLMASDHPLLGVGPGAFGWNYFSYKVRAEQRYPTLRRAWSREVNFGEVHNDHLQVVAEAGAPGYVLFVVMLGTLVSISLRRVAGDALPARRFAVLLALPLAVLWLTLSLAQFPLETTAVRMLLVHFAALCAAWRPA
jgi:O-antigen ligase